MTEFNGSIITNNGKKVLMDRFYNDDGSTTYTAPSQYKIGIEQTTPNVGDTDLDKPVPITGTEAVDDCETANWTDSADMTTALNTSTYKEGSNSLNLTKDAGTASLAYTYKSTTSLDFTSKDFSIWIYIKDATAYAKLATTDALVLRFGTDSSNYYVYTQDKADLAVGWNLVIFNSTTADSETGTVTIATCAYTYVGLTASATATTWSAGDFVMDDIKLASSGDYLGSFDTDYPILDDTAFSVETRATLSTTEANGYDINATGIFNTDTSPLMCFEDAFTAESKSSTDAFTFVWKDYY